MTMSNCCGCEERQKPLQGREWWVYRRNCNYSAFSGYRYTPSSYSAVGCARCGKVWRTKAAYVRQLRDGDPWKRREELAAMATAQQVQP